MLTTNEWASIFRDLQNRIEASKKKWKYTNTTVVIIEFSTPGASYSKKTTVRTLLNDLFNISDQYPNIITFTVKGARGRIIFNYQQPSAHQMGQGVSGQSDIVHSWNTMNKQQKSVRMKLLVSQIQETLTHDPQ